MTRIGPRQARILDYVAEHPLVCTAEVDRATNDYTPHSHKVTYDSVGRLIGRGLLGVKPGKGNRALLFVPEGGGLP